VSEQHFLSADAMLIQLRDPYLGGAPEWLFIEMQGSISVTGDGGGGFDGRLAGYLRRAEGDRLLLQVGNHTISGSFETLDKALHILQRSESEAGTEYVVSCVVRRKLVFTERSVPVISASLEGGAAKQ
jgi:hypothetical protein